MALKHMASEAKSKYLTRLYEPAAWAKRRVQARIKSSKLC